MYKKAIKNEAQNLARKVYEVAEIFWNVDEDEVSERLGNIITAIAGLFWEEDENCQFESAVPTTYLDSVSSQELVLAYLHMVASVSHGDMRGGVTDEEILSQLSNGFYSLGCIRGNIDYENTENINESKNNLIQQIRSMIGKDSVSHRIDQKLKPLWIEHCKRSVSIGAKIDRLEDLFQISDCLSDFKKNIDARTLKRWAKESAGINFKPGRKPKY